MPDTFSFTLNYPAKLMREPKVSVYKFGDGYEQRAGVGLNSNLQKWDVSADKLPLSVAVSIDSFLNTQGGVKAFNWVNPLNSSTVLVVCRKWDITLNDNEENHFSTTFEEVLG